MNFRIGDSVTVKKYGKEYPARVTAIGRTTVTVSFTTVGGSSKTIKIPGYAVSYTIKAR